MCDPKRRKTAVIDIDGVLATGTKEEVYSEEAGWAYDKCTPIQEGIRMVWKLYRSGYRIVLHTQDLRKTERRLNTGSQCMMLSTMS